MLGEQQLVKIRSEVYQYEESSAIHFQALSGYHLNVDGYCFGFSSGMFDEPEHEFIKLLTTALTEKELPFTFRFCELEVNSKKNEYCLIVVDISDREQAVEIFHTLAGWCNDNCPSMKNTVLAGYYSSPSTHDEHAFVELRWIR